MIKKGDIVRIKPEWCSPEEQHLTWIARSDKEKGRFDMSCLDYADRWTFWPMQVTHAHMVELTGRRVEGLGK